MSQQKWTEVDRYISGVLVKEDEALSAAVAASDAAGLPSIQVAPNQGKMLMLLARIQGAKRILEIGTLGGYSTIWLARALPPGGSMITLESDPKHADVARANLARAGLASVVDVRVGRALETLPSIAGPFDFFFIDADKASMPEYFAASLARSRPGSVIVFDNVVRDGAVADGASADPGVKGVRRLNEMLAAEPRVTATAIQTVGVKGYDGFAMAVVSG